MSTQDNMPTRAGILTFPAGLREEFHVFHTTKELLSFRQTLLNDPCQMTPTAQRALSKYPLPTARYVWVLVSESTQGKAVVFYAERDHPPLAAAPSFRQWLYAFNPQNWDDVLMASRLYEANVVRGVVLPECITAVPHNYIDSILRSTRGQLLWASQLLEILNCCLSPFEALMTAQGFDMDALARACTHWFCLQPAQKFLRDLHLNNNQTIWDAIRSRLVLGHTLHGPDYPAAALMWEWRHVDCGPNIVEPTWATMPDYQPSSAKQAYLATASDDWVNYELNVYPNCPAVKNPQWFAAKIGSGLPDPLPTNHTQAEYDAYVKAFSEWNDEGMKQFSDAMAKWLDEEKT